VTAHDRPVACEAADPFEIVGTAKADIVAGGRVALFRRF